MLSICQPSIGSKINVAKTQMLTLISHIQSLQSACSFMLSVTSSWYYSIKQLHHKIWWCQYRREKLISGSAPGIRYAKLSNIEYLIDFPKTEAENLLDQPLAVFIYGCQKFPVRNDAVNMELGQPYARKTSRRYSS